MAKTIQRDFLPADRYLYDFKYCTVANGWAQIDTSQDASYFGQWIHPGKREIFCYCEGDLIHTKLDTDAELVRELQEIQDFDRNYSPKRADRFGIDPGFNAELKQALIAAGLGEFLH
jgi:hypothetical protein